MPFESMLAMAAALLVAGGGAKLFDAAPTRGALRAAGLPSGRVVVTALAIWEMMVGATALAIPGPVAPLAVAATYAGFTAFVGYALARDLPLQSCGCFGRTDTPPSVIHLVVDATAALAAVFAAGSDPLFDRITANPGAGLAEAMFVAVGAYLMYLMLAELPATLAAARAGSA
jgi:hypothetical protein